MIFEGTKNQFFFGLGLTRAGISFPDIELMEELAQDDAIPVTLPDGSAGSFKDIKEGQHIQIRYLGHRVFWQIMSARSLWR